MPAPLALIGSPDVKNIGSFTDKEFLKTANYALDPKPTVDLATNNGYLYLNLSYSPYEAESPFADDSLKRCKIALQIGLDLSPY